MTAIAFTESTWGVKSLPLYACVSCPFDTLDLDLMVQHQETAHGLSHLPGVPEVVQEFDRFGHPVVPDQPTPHVEPAEPETVQTLDRFGHLVVPGKPTTYIEPLAPKVPRVDRYGNPVEE
jgi:hypothetical protein